MLGTFCITCKIVGCLIIKGDEEVEGLDSEMLRRSLAIARLRKAPVVAVWSIVIGCWKIGFRNHRKVRLKAKMLRWDVLYSLSFSLSALLSRRDNRILMLFFMDYLEIKYNNYFSISESWKHHFSAAFCCLTCSILYYLFLFYLYYIIYFILYILSISRYW